VIEIIQATSPAEVEMMRELFTEYADSLGIDLCFQGFAGELAGLPGMYAPPEGRLLPAGDAEGGRIAGCAGLRRLADGVGEMKRLYVRPAFRGRAVGRLLATAILDEARAIGYRRVRLDTLPSMAEAQRLHTSLGFVDIPPYRENPIPGARYLEVALR